MKQQIWRGDEGNCDSALFCCGLFHNRLGNLVVVIEIKESAGKRGGVGCGTPTQEVPSPAACMKSSFSVQLKNQGPARGVNMSLCNSLNAIRCLTFAYKRPRANLFTKKGQNRQVCDCNKICKGHIFLVGKKEMMTIMTK